MSLLNDNARSWIFDALREITEPAAPDGRNHNYSWAERSRNKKRQKCRLSAVLGGNYRFSVHDAAQEKGGRPHPKGYAAQHDADK
jgi:hypothetical protein